MCLLIIGAKLVPKPFVMSDHPPHIYTFSNECEKTDFCCQILHMHRSPQWSANLKALEQEEKFILTGGELYFLSCHACTFCFAYCVFLLTKRTSIYCTAPEMWVNKHAFWQGLLNLSSLLHVCDWSRGLSEVKSIKPEREFDLWPFFQGHKKRYEDIYYSAARFFREIYCCFGRLGQLFHWAGFRLRS